MKMNKQTVMYIYTHTKKKMLRRIWDLPRISFFMGKYKPVESETSGLKNQ